MDCDKTFRDWRRALLGVVLWIPAGFVAADVVRDGTLGPDATLQPAGPDFLIDAAMGEFASGGEQNLFHSFTVFDLNSAESATFTGPVSVENILARVTGGILSDIDGLIASDVDGANVFLLNPSGVVFGPNARLDVTGSFHVSTADGIRLGESGDFAASNPGNTILSIAPPSSFYFLGAAPVAPIDVNESLLQVPAGEAIGLIGGDLTLLGVDHPGETGRAAEATLYAPSGRLTLVSVASAGEVNMATDGSVDVVGFSALGDVRIAAPSAEGPLQEGANLVLDAAGDPGGRVVIRGGRLTMEAGGLISAATLGDVDHPGVAVDVEISDTFVMKGFSEIGASTFGLGDAGDVLISARRMEMAGNKSSPAFGGFGTNANIGSRSFGADFSGTSPGGDSGSVRITADEFAMGDMSFIQTTTFTTGNAGVIEIDAGTMEMSTVTPDAFSFISSSSAGIGDAGRVRVQAGDVTLQQGPGGGFVGIAAQGRSDSVGNPDGGGIEINATGRVALLDGAQVSGAIFQGAGNGARIDVTADELIIRGSRRLADGSVQTNPDFFPAGIFSNVFAGSTAAGGRSGTININANRLRISDGGSIASQASFPTLGDSGDINIDVGILELENSGSIRNNSFGFGNGGIISVLADDITITGPSIAPTFDGTGLFAQAGTAAQSSSGIDISTGTLSLIDGGEIHTTTFGLATGGAINISATAVTLSGTDTAPEEGFPSGITGVASRIASGSLVFGDFVQFSGGDGGEVNLATDTLVVDNGAGITAVTATTGNGGDVNILASLVDLSSVGALNVSSSGGGNAGRIGLRAEELRLTGGSITAAADLADGGLIVVDVARLLIRQGEITATVGGGLGNGGNVDLLARELVLLDRGSIVANAVGGSGGNIQITTGAFVADNTSVVSASSELGVDGTVVVNSPESDVEGSIVAPATSYADGASLLTERCSVATGGGSLHVSAGDGLPVNPGNYLAQAVFGPARDPAFNAYLAAAGCSK